MNRALTSISFSPGGTTAQVADQIAKQISSSVHKIDLMEKTAVSEKQFTQEDIVIVSVPVFAGRIPEASAHMLRKLKGDQTPAIAAVVYGNRAYEDALLELTELLKEQGFLITGAAAVIARHSIFPKVAQNRPDSSDIAKISEFAKNCKAAIETNTINPVTVPGKTPYRESGSIGLFPKGNSKCDGCKACVAVCPVNAIPEGNPRDTDQEKCITCTACIYACPRGARKFRGFKYQLGARAFKKKCAAYLEPEFFV